MTDDGAEGRRVLIFARVRQDLAASLKAVDASFDDARIADEKARRLTEKLTEARAAVVLLRDEPLDTRLARAALADDIEAQIKTQKDRGSDSRARATRRRREASLEAALLELRDMIDERCGR